MVTKLYDLLDKTELEIMLTDGRISCRKHESLPLYIFNYTNRAQFANEWTNAERVCRGLIVTQWDEVISRGMPKFFNYGDPHGADFSPQDVGYMTVKEDGSLGIGWTYAGEVGIATRGSFHSDQAKKATAMLTKNQVERIHLAADNDESILFEIVYPDNRIVLEYGDREENIRIGYVDHETGVFDPAFTQGAKVGAVETLLQTKIADDAEGYVVTVPGKGSFKLKGETYLNLHKLMFGLTEKSVWEMVQSHNITEREAYVNKFPPITRQWVLRKMKYFQDKHTMYVYDTNFVSQYMQRTIPGASRKEQALWLQEKYPDALNRVFAQLDGGDERLYGLIWKMIKPAHKPYKVETED